MLENLRDTVKLQVQLRIAPLVAVLAVYLAQRFAIEIDTDQVVLGATAVVMIGYDWVKWLIVQVIIPKITGG